MADVALSLHPAKRTLVRRSPFMRKAFPYLLLGPAVIYLLGITLYPGIYAVYRSLMTGKFKLEYAGLQNYRELLVDNAFWSRSSPRMVAATHRSTPGCTPTTATIGNWRTPKPVTSIRPARRR
jgi:hypothetical protein